MHACRLQISQAFSKPWQAGAWLMHPSRCYPSSWPCHGSEILKISKTNWAMNSNHSTAAHTYYYNNTASQCVFRTPGQRSRAARTAKRKCLKKKRMMWKKQMMIQKKAKMTRVLIRCQTWTRWRLKLKNRKLRVMQRRTTRVKLFLTAKVVRRRRQQLSLTTRVHWLVLKSLQAPTWKKGLIVLRMSCVKHTRLWTWLQTKTSSGPKEKCEGLSKKERKEERKE